MAVMVARAQRPGADRARMEVRVVTTSTQKNGGDTFCIDKATVPGMRLAMFSNPAKLYDLGDAQSIIKCHGATAWCRPCYASYAISCSVSCHADAQARRTGDWSNFQETAGVGSDHIAHDNSVFEDRSAPRPRVPCLRIQRQAAMARTACGGASGALGHDGCA